MSFKSFLKKYGIQSEFTAAYSPQQNDGVSASNCTEFGEKRKYYICHNVIFNENNFGKAQMLMN